jgi:hypothetical protein
MEKELVGLRNQVNTLKQLVESAQRETQSKQGKLTAKQAEMDAKTSQWVRSSNLGFPPYCFVPTDVLNGVGHGTADIGILRESLRDADFDRLTPPTLPS